MSWEVICGDSLTVLGGFKREHPIHGRIHAGGMAAGSVDSVVCDPPYALTSTKNGKRGFMGKTWDTGEAAFNPAFWTEVLRVLKPFGGDK
jgi:site-specific DNA-methyltransferase (adenine-specific)